MTAFSGHHFYDSFLQGRGDMSPPRIFYRIRTTNVEVRSRAAFAFVSTSKFNTVSMMMQKQTETQQECIPVGCVPLAHLPYLGKGVCCLPSRVCARPVGVCLGVSAKREVSSQGVSVRRGVPCDLSHHAFDITCMLSLLQMKLKSNPAAYIVLVM